MKSVYRAVRTGALNIAVCASSVKVPVTINNIIQIELHLNFNPSLQNVMSSGTGTYPIYRFASSDS